MGRKIKVLAADDHADIRESVKSVVESFLPGAEVILAENGAQAVELATQIKPDLIILDLIMPEMTGWDACGKIKSKKELESTPIIFLTGKDDPISQGMGKLSAKEYIIKPFDADDLIHRIKQLLKLPE